QEHKDLVPAIGRLLGPVGGAGGIEEGMAAAVVAVEFVVLAELLEYLLGAVGVLAVGVLVVVAKDAKDRTRHLLGKIDRRDRLAGIEHLLVIDDDVAAPAVHQRVDAGHAAGDQISVPPAGAETDHPDLTVGM